MIGLVSLEMWSWQDFFGQGRYTLPFIARCDA